MLPANLQDAMMSNVIQSLETKREYTVYFKIAVMSGRYLIDTQTKDMYQHGFLPMRFEREYFDIFKGADSEASIDKYYEALCLNRLRGMADRFVDGKDALIREGMQVDKLFSDDKGENCFKMLVDFAGYNFRRFLTFITNMCDANPAAHYFTEDMIFQQAILHYNGHLDKFRENIELQQYSPAVDAFLAEIAQALPNNTLYFALSDDQPYIIRALEYFSVITQVSDKLKDNRKIPIYLIDLSTYVSLKKYSLHDMHDLYVNGQLALFNIGNLDKVPVYTAEDLRGIQVALKIEEKYQDLAHYYQDIIDLDAELAAGEDKAYVSKSQDRILKKIEQKYKEKYTRETLDAKLKAFETRLETILKADKFVKNDLKKEDQIQKILQATLGAKAAASYSSDKESAKFAKRANMDPRLIEELIKLKITDEYLASVKGNPAKVDALANLLPVDVRGTFNKVMGV
jgi:hypothetical protein